MSYLTHCKLDDLNGTAHIDPFFGFKFWEYESVPLDHGDLFLSENEYIGDVLWLGVGIYQEPNKSVERLEDALAFVHGAYGDGIEELRDGLTYINALTRIGDLPLVHRILTNAKRRLFPGLYVQLERDTYDLAA